RATPDRSPRGGPPACTHADLRRAHRDHRFDSDSVKRKTPGGISAGRVTLFSTLFSVAAIGGKSPRTINCEKDSMCGLPTRQVGQMFRTCNELFPYPSPFTRHPPFTPPPPPH